MDRSIKTPPCWSSAAAEDDAKGLLSFTCCMTIQHATSRQAAADLSADLHAGTPMSLQGRTVISGGGFKQFGSKEARKKKPDRNHEPECV